jgi:hypothetical protein
VSAPVFVEEATMAEDNKSGSSATLNDQRTRPEMNITERPAPMAADTAVEQQMVSVKALKFFPDKDKNGNMEQKGPDSEPYDVPRDRAAQLYANGLIEYANVDDEEAHLKEKIDASAKVIRDRNDEAKRQRELAASKIKPLTNPKIDMASAKDAK